MVKELIVSLEEIYRETGEGPYPRVIPLRRVFGCEGRIR